MKSNWNTLWPPPPQRLANGLPKHFRGNRLSEHVVHTWAIQYPSSLATTPIFLLSLHFQILVAIEGSWLQFEHFPSLSGHFGTEKIYLAPSPQIPYRHPLGPSVPATPLLGEPPPPPSLLGFSMRNRPPPSSGASDSPFPSPEQKK